nr:PREDICTED: uncharacterized protein LOC109035187 isoform X2 [Bemisia tabaci]XP_018904276.1 PREDICTED: uncharacterized protein LOC109035187 isoform X2 [Bemisia tabaci]
MGDSGDTGCTDTGTSDTTCMASDSGMTSDTTCMASDTTCTAPDTTYTAPDTTYTDTAGHSNPDPINPFDPTYIGPHFGIHDPGYHTRMMDESMLMSTTTGTGRTSSGPQSQTTQGPCMSCCLCCFGLITIGFIFFVFYTLVSRAT